MHEQVNDKTIALIVRGTRFTASMLQKALRKAQADMRRMEQKKGVTKTYQGKQTVKQLVRQGSGVSNIEIADDNIKAFERIARKHGIDFALKKDASVTPPKWMVFFKAKDSDALDSAISDYTALIVKRDKAQKPSLLENLKRMKERVRNQVVDKTRNKHREGPEL